jgi:hypothetical protein
MAAVTSGLERHWLAVALQSYQDLWINSSPRCPDKLSLLRYVLGRILAARTGHSDFVDYHEPFNHEDAHLHCRCDASKSQSTSSSAEWLRAASSDPRSPLQGQFPS